MENATIERDTINHITDLYNTAYDEGSSEETWSESHMSEDEIHNSHISEKYKELLNSDRNSDKNNTFFRDQPVEGYTEDMVYAETGETRYSEEMDSEPVHERAFNPGGSTMANWYLFNAESPVNEPFMNDSIIKGPVRSSSSEDIREEANIEVEEENEDLRPSATTIQYIDGVHSEDTVQEKPRTGFFASLTESKKRRLMFGGFCAILFALVVLVIVNSAVISHLSKSIETARAEEQTVEAVAEGYGAEDTAYEIHE